MHERPETEKSYFQRVKDEGDAHETEVWDEDVTMTTMLELKNALRVNVEVRWLNLLTKRGRRWRWLLARVGFSGRTDATPR